MGLSRGEIAAAPILALGGGGDRGGYFLILLGCVDGGFEIGPGLVAELRLMLNEGQPSAAAAFRG